jgi:membrane protease YdiL (CAAX protease family)
MSRNTLFLLAGGSFVLFSAIGWAIMEYFSPVSLSTTLQQGDPLVMQVVWGLILGLSLGTAAWLLVNHPFLKRPKEFFVDIIGPWELTWLEIVLVSCCAGIGEEILFRGGIQPFLGIIWTSLLFVILHGYITPFNGPLTIYGIFMVLAIALLGLATVHLGLVVAIVAHTTIDILLLFKLSRTYSSSSKDISQE